VPSASVYLLDEKSLESVLEAARRLPPLTKSFHPVRRMDLERH
jgi:hypothetical protein